MKIDTEIEKQRWYSRPRHKDPKAIIPLYLAGFGSLCLQAVSLFWWNSHGPSQDHIWEALAIVGIVFISLGFMGSFVYRHFRVAAVALVVALISPLLWGWPFLWGWTLLWGRPGLVIWFLLWFGWLRLLPSCVVAFLQGHLVVIWLFLQIPVAILVLWLGSWQRRVKLRTTILTAGVLVCFFVVITLQAHYEVATAPHVSDEYLSAVYEKNDKSAIKRLDHKRIVVTGIIFGTDGGLLANEGPYQMQGIECDDLVGYDSLKDGETVSIIGTCEGRDVYGLIHLTDGRLLK